MLCREVRDLKSQLSSHVSDPSSQNWQQVQRERDIIKADRTRLLARVSQLERDVTRMEAIERQKSNAVSLQHAVANLGMCRTPSLHVSDCIPLLLIFVQCLVTPTCPNCTAPACPLVL